MKRTVYSSLLGDKELLTHNDLVDAFTKLRKVLDGNPATEADLIQQLKRIKYLSSGKFNKTAVFTGDSIEVIKKLMDIYVITSNLLIILEKEK